MKITSTLSFLLTSFIVLGAQATFIRGADKQGESNFEAKMSDFISRFKDRGSHALNPSEKDRELDKEVCPAFLKVAKGAKPQANFACYWYGGGPDADQSSRKRQLMPELPIWGASSYLYCGVFDISGEVPLFVGEVTGSSALSCHLDYETFGGSYAEFCNLYFDGILNLFDNSISAPISGQINCESEAPDQGPPGRELAPTAQSCTSDVRLGTSYIYGSTSKEPCLNKYKALNTIAVNEFDLGLFGDFDVEFI